MMKLHEAQLITAIITPFTTTGEINYDVIAELVEHLQNTGTQGLVIGGTTGEGATLSNVEKLELYRYFGLNYGSKIPLIANVGTNDTRATIEFVRSVGKISGLKALLVVVPYYNRPNQAGLLAHFQAVADKSTLPIIIYNIPARTGVNLEKETIVKLSQHKKIIGVKQCGNLSDLAYIVEQTADDFLVYTGEDQQTLTAKVLGADGVISVASHFYGDAMQKMLSALEQGDVAIAAKWQRLLLPAMQTLFMFPSPAPVKALFVARGLAVGGCRLPMTTMTTEQTQLLQQLLGLQNKQLQKWEDELC